MADLEFADIEVDVALSLLMDGKTIKHVSDDDTHYRTSLDFEFTDGTKIRLTACGCCNGIEAMDLVAQEEIAARNAKREAEIAARWAEEDAENAARGLI